MAFGLVVVTTVQAIVVPWSFYLGGTFHPVPGWQGIARIHTSSGTYVLYVWMTPVTHHRAYNYPSLSGSASLCTPAGERVNLHLNGSMLDRVGSDANGKQMRLDIYRRPWYATFAGVWDRRPDITLRGRWQYPDLVMNDGGTLSVAFQADGRVYDGPVSRQPHARETVPVVFHAVPWTAWFADCRVAP